MLGWLHVIPEGEKLTRSQIDEWPLPDCEKASYLAHWFGELRLSFGYSDIESWSKLTGSLPSPCDVDLLMSMSGTYSNSLVEHKGKEHNLVPPFDGRTKEDADAMINDKMKRSIARFINAD